MTSTPAASAETAWQAELFTAYALPGCSVPVVTPGDVCTPCQYAFGDLLRLHAGPALDPEQVAADLRERDEGVRAQYRAHTAVTTAAQPDSLPKRNQVCWLCEERRTCTREETGFECAHCRDQS